MQKRKALLLYPAPISQMPLGLGYIGAVLEQKGFKVKIVVNTFRREKSVDDLVRIAATYQPDLVGISYVTLQVLNVFRLVAKLKQQTRALVVAGGVHPSCMPREGVENGFDIVVRGEGESAIALIADNLRDGAVENLDTIPGITFRRGTDIIENPDSERIMDLDTVPFPARHLFDRDDFAMPDGSLKGYERVFMGRGCPGRCTFCKSVFGNTYSHRSVEHVIKEITFVRETYGITDFCLGDDTLSFDKKLTFELTQAILDHKLDITWNCGTRVNAVDEERLRLMKLSGCRTISFGAESGDDQTLKLIKKGQTLKQIKKAVELTHAAGIPVYLNVMTGFPWETPEHVRHTTQMVQDLSPIVHVISVLGTVVPVPNSEIYQQGHEKYGFTNYWLRDDPIYQNAGQAIFQNVTNPYEISTYYQRNMYDDTYIVRETFFPYSAEYKRAVKELCFAIGRHNMKVRHQSKLRQYAALALARMSRLVYEVNPDLEMMCAKLIPQRKNRLHDIKNADLRRVENGAGDSGAILGH